jgi:hypothetical protein
MTDTSASQPAQAAPVIDIRTRRQLRYFQRGLRPLHSGDASAGRGLLQAELATQDPRTLSQEELLAYLTAKLEARKLEEERKKHA